MNQGPRSILPAGFPRPPLPGALFNREGKEEEEINIDEVFKQRLKAQGYDEELIEKGLKVAHNHMRPPGEAYQIGENYIREMAK